jgi:hypothetical protein
MQQVAYVSAMLTTPFFAVFGWAWFYVSATFGIFMMANYILSMVLRMFGLWRERGLGWWLIGGLWAATYNLLLLPTTVVKKVISFNREQAERALLTRAMDGPACGADSSQTQRLPGGSTEFRPNAARRPSFCKTYKASDSLYHSANRQIDKARATLTRQQEAAAHKLDGVHHHYKGLITQYKAAPNAPKD